MTSPSAIETLLAVKPVADNDDVFTDQSPPQSARQGRVFGGITLGQGLNAAQNTVRPDFVAHAMHSTFVSARQAATPTAFHVERVKDGRQYCVRSVRAVQGGRTIFLAVVSFVCESQSSAGPLQHARRFPHDVPPPGDEDDSTAKTSPFLNHSVGVRMASDPPRIHQWIRARHPLQGTQNDHLAALACLSDSYLLAAAPHSHGIWAFDHPPVSEVYDSRQRLTMPSAVHHKPILRPYLLFPEEHVGTVSPRVTAMASLDHTLYFHNPTRLHADQWLLAEIHSEWEGSGRAVVQQAIWGADGTLVATCMQEGVVGVSNGMSGARL